MSELTEHYRVLLGLDAQWRVEQVDFSLAEKKLEISLAHVGGRLCCPEFKGDRFPETVDGGPLINPCVDSPSKHFEFRYDPIAKIASVYGRTDRGRVSEILLGLNRHELRPYRSRQIEKLVVLALFAATDLEAAALLTQAKSADSEYSAFARILFA